MTKPLPLFYLENRKTSHLVGEPSVYFHLKKVKHPQTWLRFAFIIVLMFCVSVANASTNKPNSLTDTIITPSATLSKLGISSGKLAPSFNSKTLSYTASVSNTVTGITLTPSVSSINLAEATDSTAYGVSAYTSSLSGNNYEAGFLVSYGADTVIQFYYKSSVNVEVDNSGYVAKRYSYNKGKTWVYPANDTVYNDQYYNGNVAGAKLDNGRIVIFFRKYDSVNSIEIGNYSMYSDDKGMTWSTPVALNFTYPPSAQEYVYGNIIKVGNKYLCLASNFYFAEKFTSTDGAIWTSEGMAWDYSTSKFAVTSENTLIKCNDNNIIIISRNQDARASTTKAPYIQFKSTDGGNTFIYQGATNMAPGGFRGIGPCEYYDALRNKIVVIGTFRDIKKDFTLDKLMVYTATPSAVLSSPTAWSQLITIPRPYPHSARDFFGYAAIAQLSSSSWLAVFNDRVSPDGSSTGSKSDIFQFNITSTNITVNGVAVASGDTSQNIPLNVGNNTVNIVAAASVGISKQIYQVVVKRAASSNATLSSIAFGSGISIKHTTTVGNVSNYTATVGSSIASVTVVPTAQDATATITVNNTRVLSGATSNAITLNPGSNTITTLVTAQDGTTTRIYSVVITRTASANATLSSIKVNPGVALKHVTTVGNVANYTASVSSSISSITITPTAQDATAIITVNNAPVLSGETSDAILLNTGPNTITTVVTAQDGTTTRIYSVVITRTASANATLSSIKVNPDVAVKHVTTVGNVSNYTATVGNSIASVTVLPTAQDATATITVNNAPVLSGETSDAILLNTGPNTITTVVTAQDGTTTRIYSVVITRTASANATLSSIIVSPGAGLKHTTTVGNVANYTGSVSSSIASVTVLPTAQDATATITVNNAPVLSGETSDAILLNTGPNTITTVVTAQDGTNTRTYSVVITRASHGTADLGPVYKATDSVATVKTDSTTNTPKTEISDNIVVHSAVSPDGDGINDFLKIDGIEAYTDNKLTIVSSSGSAVYRASGYNNTTVIFDGHSNINGTMQEQGTYYYILSYKINNKTQITSGYFILKY